MRFSKQSSTWCIMVVVLLAGALVAGCGDDGGTGTTVIEVSDFEGIWVAVSYEVTSVATPQKSIDFVFVGGAFSWDVDDQGVFTGRAFVPAALAGTTMELPFQGNFDLISQDSIEVAFNPEVDPFLTGTRAAFTLSGDTFTMTDENSTFDFGQGLEPVTAEAELARYYGTEPPVIFVSDFEGYWEATSYRVTLVANPAVTMEVISMGASFDFDVESDGSFTGDGFIPGAIVGEAEDVVLDNYSGSLNLVKQDSIQVAFTPEIDPFLTDTYGGLTVRGDSIDIVDENTSFDFDGNEVEEPAIFEGTMVKTGSMK